jgi:hypothetical protein
MPTKTKPDPNLPATTETNPITNPNGSTGPKGIPIEKILDCRAKGLTLVETAKLCDCSEANIVKRIKDVGLETLDQFNAQRVSIYDLVEKKHLEKVLDGESKRPMEDMTIAAIAGDKGRLIRGQSTSIVEHRTMQIDLNKAIDQLRAEQQLDTFDTVDAEVVDCPTSNAL